GLVCTLNAGVPPIVRADGLSELIADAVLTCSGGVAGQSTPVNLSAFLNVSITSRLVNNATEALLLIDDPPPGLLSPGANVFRATQAGANQVVWSGVPVVAPGPGKTRLLRITNVRGNASQIGAGSLVPTQIVMLV